TRAHAGSPEAVVRRKPANVTNAPEASIRAGNSAASARTPAPGECAATARRLAAARGRSGSFFVVLHERVQIVEYRCVHVHEILQGPVREALFDTHHLIWLLHLQQDDGCARAVLAV